jgi:L,D-peptidoglycan transpeptidase YkuD (ErfK/YbiS/YcfS/YnhG family)
MKREGDGATPLGVFSLSTVVYRADRMRRPRTGLAARAIDRRDGWCDDPADRNYNRPVRHPYAASAEAMWRHDHLYDAVIILDYNTRPRVRGRGSAIFVHVAPTGNAPTAGCIALSRHDLLLLIERLDTRAVFRIGR